MWFFAWFVTGERHCWARKVVAGTGGWVMQIGRHCLSGLIAGVVCASLSGCVQRHPIELGAPDPWQETYEAEQDALSASEHEPTETISSNRVHAATDEVDNTERGGWGVASDIIAFPFRGLGWLLQKLV